MAYVIPKSLNNTLSSAGLSYLPETGTLKNGRKVIFDSYKDSDVEELFKIFQEVIQEGQTFPYEIVETMEDFHRYYMSHEVFVLRDGSTNQVLGAFYVKPNYPGRSSHICNGGFMVKGTEQGQGVCSYLVPKYLRVASDLGYRGSVFNLVYVTNLASIKLWKNFGFKEIGRIPNAGNLKGLGYTDAIIFYYDLTTLKNN